MLSGAVECCNGPVAVRYPRGGNGKLEESGWNPNRGIVSYGDGEDGVIITYGTMTNEVLHAAEILNENGCNVSVLRLTKLTSISEKELTSFLDNQENILIVEEATGGLKNSLTAMIHRICPNANVNAVDLGDQYVTHGSIYELYQKQGLDAKSISDRLMEVRNHEN